MWAGEQVAACLNIELARKESVAPFLSQVIREDLFPPLVCNVSFPRKKKKVVLPYKLWERSWPGAECGWHEEKRSPGDAIRK